MLTFFVFEYEKNFIKNKNYNFFFIESVVFFVI